jgi:general secretion pathway protein D
MQLLMRMKSSANHRRTSRWAAVRYCAPLLAVALLVGCATGNAVRSGDTAVSEGDWDSAVTFYRAALGENPDRTDLKIKLERATRMAAAEHVTRARQLEEQDQLPGAVAEYRLAADLDPSNVLAGQKAGELEARIRERVEAARPRTPVDALRDQGAQTSTIPRLDPRAVVAELRFPNASVRDILVTISKLTGINVNYDQGLDAALSRPYPIDVQQTPLEEVLNQILQANNLTFKVQNSRTIFVYQDTIANRTRYEDQYIQTFYLSSANAQQMLAQINQLIGATQMAVRPVVTANEATNTLSVKATAPVLQVIDSFLKANDRSVPEVMIEAEILEVDRAFLRQMGLDLSQWALGFTFSPEVSPGNTPGVFPPTSPPPFNLNTISRGISAADFYMTSPTALIQLLESNSNTRTLAKPSTRGAAGRPVILTMGQEVPIPTTVFQASAVGGVANVPTTSVNYVPVGVNLRFTPTVTYENEIILSDLELEKSGLGANLEVGGQSFPTIVSRKAASSIRLRDGESTMIAGLLLDEERTTARTLPGLSNIPLIRNILGGTENQVTETDIVMIITPRIVRGHGLTAADVRPQYIGTGQNMSSTGAPQLMTPETLGTTAPAPGPMPPAAAPTPPAPANAPALPPLPTTTPVPEVPPPSPVAPPAALAPSSPAAPIVPVAPAGPAAPAIDDAQTRVILLAPSTGPGGTLLAGGGPHTVPIQIVGATDLATLSLTISYDPSVIKAPTVTAGSFMGQGGVQSTFVPGIDGTTGRIDLAFARPTSTPGATGTGLLAAIAFRAGDPGVTEIRITGVGTTSKGLSVPLQFSTGRVTVR